MCIYCTFQLITVRRTHIVGHDKLVYMCCDANINSQSVCVLVCLGQTHKPFARPQIRPVSVFPSYTNAIGMPWVRCLVFAVAHSLPLRNYSCIPTAFVARVFASVIRRCNVGRRQNYAISPCDVAASRRDATTVVQKRK